MTDGRLEALIPRPRMLVEAGLPGPAPRIWRVFAASPSATLAAAMRDGLGMHRMVASAAEADLVVEDAPAAGLPDGLAGWQSAEAHALRIADGRAVITADRDLGRCHGVRTLAQIATLCGRRLPGVSILDWPALRFRGAHLTLGSGHQPRFPDLLGLVADLASLKMTSFTIEYDDGFRWERHPYIARAGSLGKDQVRELIAFARDRHVEVIPLVDSLGHQEHYLRHPQLAHLRELPGRVDELCPSNPAGLAFIKDLWSEVLEVHGPGTWANITGDEVFRLGGHCPRCASHAQGGPPADLYGDWYADLTRWMLERGRRPMLWHDMLVQFPDQLARLPRECGLIYWNYWPVDQPRWAVGHGLHGALFPGDIERLPEQVRATHEAHWRHPEDPHAFRPWSFLPWLAGQGFTTFAASGGSPMESPHPCMGFAGRVDNAKSLAHAAADCGAEGLLHTYWASFASPLAALHSWAAAADHAWHPRAEPAGAFLARWGRLRHGEASGYPSFAAACDRAFYPSARGAAPCRHPDAELAGVRRAASHLAPERHAGELEPHRAAIGFEHLRRLRAWRGQQAVRAVLGAGRDTPISLSGVGRGTRLGFIAGTDGARLDLPAGELRTHGARFAIPAAGPGDSIVFRSRRQPEGVERAEIPVGQAYDSLLLLHAVCWLGEGAVAATMRILYRDGAEDRHDIVVGSAVGDWYGGRDALPDALIGWDAQVHPYSQIPARAYLHAWHGRRPGQVIDRIVITPGGGEGHMILLALTGRMGRTGLGDPRPPASCRGIVRRFSREYEAAMRTTTVPEHLPRALRMLGVDR